MKYRSYLAVAVLLCTVPITASADSTGEWNIEPQLTSDTDGNAAVAMSVSFTETAPNDIEVSVRSFDASTKMEQRRTVKRTGNDVAVVLTPRVNGDQIVIAEVDVTRNGETITSSYPVFLRNQDGVVQLISFEEYASASMASQRAVTTPSRPSTQNLEPGDVPGEAKGGSAAEQCGVDIWCLN